MALRNRTYATTALIIGALVGNAPAQTSSIRTFDYRLDEAYVEVVGFRDRLHRSFNSFRSDLIDNEIGGATTVHLGLKGSIYHPRLVEWSASGGLTLKRRRFSAETEAPARVFDESLRDYDLSSTILKGRSLSLRLNTNRRTSTVDGDFIAGTNITTKGSRAILSHRFSRVTQSLSVLKNNFFSEGLIDNEEDRFQARYQGIYRDRLFQSQGRAEYEDVDFITAMRGFTGKSARWLNTLRLTSDGRSSVSGGIDYYERNGSAANKFEQYSLSTTSQLRRDLQVSGSASKRNQDVDRVRSDSKNFSGAVTHQLYRSLTSTGSVDFFSTDFDLGSEDELTRSIGFLYDKITRLGILQTRYSQTYRRHEEDYENQAILSRSEEFSYTPGFPILLAGVRIDTLSIEVGNRDSSSLFVYTRGIDYRVAETAGQIEIQVVPSGAIQPGDSLVVTYTEFVAQGESFDETTRRYGITFTVARRLVLRADRSAQDQSPIHGSTGFLLDDSRVTEYSIGWSGGNLHARADYRFSKSGRNPYKLRVVNGEWTRLLSRKSQLSLGATYSVTDFPDQLSTSIVRLVNASYRYQPSRRLSVMTRGSYTSQSGRRDDGHAWVFSARAAYRVEQVLFEFRGDYYDRVTDIVGADDRLNFRLAIRRTIR